jgi:hypothetical protein
MGQGVLGCLEILYCYQDRDGSWQGRWGLANALLRLRLLELQKLGQLRGDYEFLIVDQIRTFIMKLILLVVKYINIYWRSSNFNVFGD